MNIMKKYTLLSLIACVALLLNSCNNYMDLTPTSSQSDKMLFADANYTELAVNRFYHFIDAMGQFDVGQSSVGLTEGMTETLKYGCTALNTHMWFANQIAYAEDGLPASTAAFFLGSWDLLYGYISQVNIAIRNIDKYAAYDDATKTRLLAECRFFRGWLYFEILKRSKQCILRTEDLDNTYQYNMPLSSEADCWQYVYDELEFAATNLPETSATGRLTKYAAYGMLSRAMLYAERWQDAFDAASAVIKSGKYSLTADYKTAWSTTAAQGNTESIIEYQYNLSGVTHSFDLNFSPGGDAGIVTGALGTPTQEMVEMYEKANGTQVDWSQWDNATTTATTATPPYDELEPRFAETIIYNGCTWKGRTMNITTDAASKDGYIAWKEKPQTGGKTTTGYFLRKLVDETHDMSVNDRATSPWIALRYAEVLLNASEAAYHISGKEADARTYMNQVRARVNLPQRNYSGTDLLAAIQHERKVELAFEGQLYWDMRRWKLSATAYTGTRVHGLRIDRIGGVLNYTYVDCDGQDRYFPARLYQIPMPEDELQNNTAVQQFEAWR
jgi:hypothetical protein